jgi:hypothetical protein
MKHLTTNTLMIFAALAGSAALRAQDSVELPLEGVCQYANGSTSPRTIQIKTSSGQTVEGVCFTTTVDEIQVKTPQGIVNIARAQLSRVTLVDIQAHHQLRHLFKHVGKGLDQSAKLIPTEAGLGGLIGIPAILAYGAVATPFCLLGDIIGYTKTTEVKIL